MKILDDKSLQLLWSWSALDKAELEQRFKTGLIALLDTLRSGGEQAVLDRGGKAGLAEELAEAGAILDECAANCLTLASTLRAEAGQEEGAMPRRLACSEGQKVMLSRTNVKELQEGGLVLEEVKEGHGIVGKDGEYWQTPLNRLLLLPREDAGHEGDPEPS